MKDVAEGEASFPGAASTAPGINMVKARAKAKLINSSLFFNVVFSPPYCMAYLHLRYAHTLWLNHKSLSGHRQLGNWLIYDYT